MCQCSTSNLICACPQEPIYCLTNCDLCGVLNRDTELDCARIIDEFGEPHEHAIVCNSCRELPDYVSCRNCLAIVHDDQTEIVRGPRQWIISHSYTQSSASNTGDSEPLTVCTLCADECVVCDECGNRTLTDYGEQSTQLCSSCRRDFAFCGACEVFFNVHNGAYDGNIHLCHNCADDYFTCEECGNFTPPDEIIETHHGYFCVSCVPDDDDGPGPYIVDCMRSVIGAPCLATAHGTRFFGVELEFSEAPYIATRDLCHATGWGACEDGSCAQEIKSPKLSGDAGIISCRTVCQRLIHDGFDVDSHCGYHLHLDMTHEKELNLTRIACAYQIFLPVWKLFVPVSRRRNSYCSNDEYNGSAKEIAEGKKIPHKHRTDRYSAINWCAYREHKTVEIRLHTGTMLADKVCNWITAHLAFVAHFRRVPFVQLMELDGATLPTRWEYLAEHVFAPFNVAEYYHGRAIEFGTTDLRRVENKGSANV